LRSPKGDPTIAATDNYRGVYLLLAAKDVAEKVASPVEMESKPDVPHGCWLPFVLEDGGNDR